MQLVTSAQSLASHVLDRVLRGADIAGMKLLSRLIQMTHSDVDALADFRNRIAYRVSAIAAVVLLPFTVLHFFSGSVLLAVLILGGQCLLVWIALSLRAGRPPPVPLWSGVSFLIVAVTASAALDQGNGVFWAFPTLFICYYVLERRIALLLSVVLVLTASLGVAHSVGILMGLRAFATLALTLAMINIVLNVIGELQQALVAQAITDPLTGAYNRRHLQGQLALLTQAGGALPVAHAMLAIDIDHFKRINDQHGHDVGDQVLKQTVAIVQQRKRRSDMLFRTGGEEFVLLLPGTAQADALRVADELRSLIEHAALLPVQSVTVSIGVGMQAAGQGADDWLKGADRALYEAKRGGRNRVAMAT